ncbi:hypothetical protein PMF13cell1_05470 [Blautia producta]|uniref:DUF4956 domain-containing protein n=1 Tax=Blautia producta TaxID=33035 RepID=A0A4P6M5M4_9FIRM|nr:DUF4956 domain-containing protein [Blautia producta]QBE99876.1 hypothetical protein PMF13cell1_05470 [Blautia producta]
MKNYIYSMFEETGSLNTEQIILNILVAVILGGVIYLSYYFTHAGGVYSKKFNVSLITLTTLTATVMTVIGNNIALSLGMVGALSIVRFRTAIKDSRDTTYIFWTIIVGICCGVGDYVVACVGSGVVFLVLLVLGRVKNDNRMLLIIRGARNMERRIEAIVFDYFEAKAMLRVKNTSRESIELIYEMPRKTYLISNKKEKSVAEMLYELESIEYVNIVTQNDEISG